MAPPETRCPEARPHPNALEQLKLKLATLLLFCAPSVLGAQNRTTVLLDPAHGGTDSGATMASGVSEKQVTLALSSRLRTALAAQNFNVVITRDADTLVDPDLRAGIANHSRAPICILLHATDSGSGVHLYTANLEPAEGPASPIPWATAQASFVAESHRLANRIGLRLLGSHIPTFVSSASVRPIDNLTCPAVLLELAPSNSPGAPPIPPSDPAYQQRIAETVAKALVVWRSALPSPGAHAALPAGAGLQP